MRIEINPRSLLNLEHICEVLYKLHPSVLDVLIEIERSLGKVLGLIDLDNTSLEEREFLADNYEEKDYSSEPVSQDVKITTQFHNNIEDLRKVLDEYKSNNPNVKILTEESDSILLKTIAELKKDKNSEKFYNLRKFIKMSNMLQKTYKNSNLGVEITSFIDKQQNIFFIGKDVAKILGYSDTNQAIRKHVDEEDKFKGSVKTTGGLQQTFYINESGFYSLLLSSKLETAKKFKNWVTTEVLPAIRKHSQYKMFDSPWNKMIMISNERELHFKVVQLIRNYYPDALLVAGLGENQDIEDKRLDSYKKGYSRGQPDLMILNYHKDYKGLCIEFKSPTNNYEVSESQLKMKDKYKKNNYAFTNKK